MMCGVVARARTLLTMRMFVRLEGLRAVSRAVAVGDETTEAIGIVAQRNRANREDAVGRAGNIGPVAQPLERGADHVDEIYAERSAATFGDGGVGRLLSDDRWPQ